MKRYFTILLAIGLLAILLFLLIPLSYSRTLPFVYWINQFLFFSLLMALVFVNTRVLIPKFLIAKKYFQYYLILLICCISIIIILNQTEILLKIPEAMGSGVSGSEHKGHGKSILSVGFYIFLVEVLVLGVNISSIIMQKWKEEENLRLLMEKEKVDLELSFLKTQINPHFFFNSLNTVNALTYSDITQSRVALKKLGHIMRYVLYNTTTTKSSLGNEIEFITNYLELMKLRSSSKVSIDFYTNVQSENMEIAPMLFLSLIENCYKHGVSSQKNSPIFISIESSGNVLTFRTKNNIFEDSKSRLATDQYFGIGMKNTKRRLDLIYPDKYSLVVEKDKEFIVTLKIELK